MKERRYRYWANWRVIPLLAFLFSAAGLFGLLALREQNQTARLTLALCALGCLAGFLMLIFAVLRRVYRGLEIVLTGHELIIPDTRFGARNEFEIPLTTISGLTMHNFSGMQIYYVYSQGMRYPIQGMLLADRDFREIVDWLETHVRADVPLREQND